MEFEDISELANTLGLISVELRDAADNKEESKVSKYIEELSEYFEYLKEYLVETAIAVSPNLIKSGGKIDEN